MAPKGEFDSSWHTGSFLIDPMRISSMYVIDAEFVIPFSSCMHNV